MSGAQAFGPGAGATSFATSTSGDPNVGYGDFSIDFWLKTTSTSGTQTILDKRTGTIGNNLRGYGVSMSNGRILLQLDDGTFTNYLPPVTASFPAGPTFVATGQWEHVAITIDRDGLINFYINAALTASMSPLAHPGSLTNAAPLTFGRDTLGIVANYVGALDEVEIFRRALTAQEVTGIFGAGPAGKCKGNIPPTCVAPPAGMTAWYPFDETAGTVAVNLRPPAPFANLFSGTSHVAGKVSNAVAFDGVTGFARSTTTDPNVGAGDFSIDFWIKTTSSQGTETILDKRTGMIGNLTGYSVAMTYGHILLQLANGTFTNYVSAPSVADGAWHHVAITVMRTSTTGIDFYIDGVLETVANPMDHPGSLTNNAPLTFGMDTLGIASHYNGVLDEVEIFTRALDVDTVQSLVDAGGAGKCKDSDTPPTPTCTQSITGSVVANLAVTSGTTCIKGGTVAGTITVQPGAGLLLSGATVGGSIKANGASSVTICSSVVGGNVAVKGSTGAVFAGNGGDGPPATCKGNVFGGSVQLGGAPADGNNGGLEFGGNIVGGTLIVSNNAGSIELEANTVGGGLSCHGNTPAPANDNRANTVGGPRSGQTCAVPGF